MVSTRNRAVFLVPSHSAVDEAEGTRAGGPLDQGASPQKSRPKVQPLNRYYKYLRRGIRVSKWARARGQGDVHCQKIEAIGNTVLLVVV